MIALALPSCNNWLDLKPENAQTSEEYWQTKEEVEAVLMSGYVELRKNIKNMLVWGEVRGYGVFPIALGTTPSELSSLNQIRSLNILPGNAFAKWEAMYKVIGMANSVIKYGPDVVGRDDSFYEGILNSWLAEAYFLRSLAYFYLVRTYGEVPLVLEPYVDDSAPYELEKSSEEIILTQIITDLENVIKGGAAKEYFEETNPLNPMNSKGRATRWAVYALMADIYLWQGEYAKCEAACDQIIYNSGRVGLIQKEYWFTNFNPGNSNESIFEIQFARTLGQDSPVCGYFLSASEYLWVASVYSYYQLQFSVNDVRTAGTLQGGIYQNIWKWTGSTDGVTTRDANSQKDANWIVYRLAEIYLMKAESRIMRGDFSGGAEMINVIRERAGANPIYRIDSEPEMIDLLLNERLLELTAEGKNWFDLFRIAKRDNYKYKEKLIDYILQSGSLQNEAMVRIKLSDPYALYMPIHKDELINNKLLVQNPYYENLGN